MANIVSQLLSDTLLLAQAELVLIMSSDDPTNVAAVVELAKKELADLPVSPVTKWFQSVVPQAAQDWIFTLIANTVAKAAMATGFFKSGETPS